MATNKDFEKIRRKYPSRLTRGRSIKFYCKSQCCCDDLESWRNCTISSCFLWPFRFGKEILAQSKIPQKNDTMPIKNQLKRETSGDLLIGGRKWDVRIVKLIWVGLTEITAKSFLLIKIKRWWDCLVTSFIN